MQHVRGQCEDGKWVGGRYCRDCMRETWMLLWSAQNGWWDRGIGIVKEQGCGQKLRGKGQGDDGPWHLKSAAVRLLRVLTSGKGILPGVTRLLVADSCVASCAVVLGPGL